MEGQSSTENSQYQYQWQRLVRRNTVADALPISSPSPTATPQLSSQIDLLPILLPQHSSYHQAQLAQYNRLITSGRGTRVHSSPLPPVLSSEHIHSEPRSRSGTSGGSTARTNKSSARVGHGNREPRKSSKGERALVTEKDKSATMPAKKLELPTQLQSRPLAQHQNSNLSQQSNSVPSTPHQHARKFSFESREPSPTAINHHSPRSAYSESNIVLPSRPPPAPRGGCRYETAMAHTRRRMPYSLGGEKLDRLSPKDIKSKLSKDEERKLTTDMRELYDRLLPTAESEKKREKLVQKLEKMFNEQWPGHDIRVHMFGSSGNLLCTDQSDVDICITTEWKELEAVCKIADLLAKNGMEKVICVSTAKVPIVKIFDPETELFCDMNVNNTLALENTRMIKTYVQIDDRVRPLAMIIKHWTKRRILNDAAFGGTLSSYTWICMIINFLQSRNPVVLPALHQRPHMKLPMRNGIDSSFADDLAALQASCHTNKESLGELLFSFFHFYAHDFDYENLVISVRHGKQISKTEKKWHLTNNNRLCVEEPFNVSRNLGNTADDTSFRGLHIELRRAFDLISQGMLDECCEEYAFPPQEISVFQRPPAKPKPVLRSTSQSSRGGRGGSHRGGRHNNNNQHGRNNNGNRRASSATFESHPTFLPGGLPPNLSTQEAWLQRQAQAQLHNDLYATYSVLQAQENSLRLQLYNQSQQYLQAQQHQVYAQSHGQNPGNSAPVKQHATDRNRTNSFDQPPLTAPIRPDMYFYPLSYQTTPLYGYQTPSTNPPSPSLSSATPDLRELRRSMHRSNAANGSGSGGGQSSSSMRSHSQPATRSGPAPLSLQGPGMTNTGLGIYQTSLQPNGNTIPSFIPDENSEPGFDTPVGSSATTPPEENTPKEYVGYYVHDSVPSHMRRQPLMPTMAIPAFGDINGQSRRRLSQDQLPQSILDRLKRPSRSPSPLGHDRSYSSGPPQIPVAPTPSHYSVSSTNLRTLNTQAPLVANGSTAPAPLSIPNWQASMSESSTSDGFGSDIRVGSMETASQISATDSDISGEQNLSGQLTPRESRPDSCVKPVVVNGSTPMSNSSCSIMPGLASDGLSSHSPSLPNGSVSADSLNALPRLSPKSRNRLARQLQNGGMSPLDITTGLKEPLRDDLPHLSPVFETRTPSPTANRKFELAPAPKANGFVTKVTDEESVPVKDSQKGSPLTGNQSKQNLAPPKINGHTRGSKSEGGGPDPWQKISKNKKKGHPAEMKSARNGQPLSEKPPNNEFERKGG